MENQNSSYSVQIGKTTFIVCEAVRNRQKAD